MNPLCLRCGSLSGCPILSDDQGKLVPERLLPQEAELLKWELIGPGEAAGRERQYTMSGIGCIRALHLLPRGDPEIKNLREMEVEEQRMLEDTPDFGGMLYEGITYEEREEQLLYETDDNGDFVVEPDNAGELVRRHRPSYQVRNFACNPEGYIQQESERLELFFPRERCMFDPAGKVIKHILRIESKSGLITKKKKATVKPAATKPSNEKEIQMPGPTQGNRVVLNRGKKPGGGGKPGGAKVPAKASGGKKVAGPPGKRKGPPGKKPASSPNAGSNGAAAPGLDELQEAISRVVADRIEETKNELIAYFDVRFRELLAGTTVLYDDLILSGGTMQYQDTDDDGEPLWDDDGDPVMLPFPALSDEPNLVLARLPEEGSGE